MIYGNGLKNKYLNKKRIIIYQRPLIERILTIGQYLLILIPIVCLILGYEHVIETIIILLVLIVYCIYINYIAFNTYICLDLVNNKLIIKEYPGIKKQEYNLDYIMNITISDAKYYNKYFTIDINFKTFTKKIKSWSWSSRSSKMTLFGGYKIQTKRLKKFCEECNRYLASRQK